MPRPPLIKRLRPGDWVALDAVAAVLLAVVFVVGSTRPAYRIPIGVAYLVALVSTLPAAVRRLWPLPVLGAVLAGSSPPRTPPRAAPQPPRRARPSPQAAAA